MEQHPVPQNVTTFQFRLVGDMTIKQFGYLAGGIIVGYIFYKLPLPFFFTWPLAISSGLLGFGLAFVPVEERPMDIWIASFFKNVYSPTQWVWQKEKGVRAPPPAPSTHPAAPQPVPVAAPQPPKGGMTAAVHTIPTVPHASPLSQIVNALASFLASILPAPKSASAALKPKPQTAVQHPAQTPRSTPQSATPAPPASRAILTIHHTTSPLDWLRSLFRSTVKPPTPSLSPGFSFADALAAGPAPSVAGKHIEPPNEPQAPGPPLPPSTPPPAVMATPSPVPSTTRPTAHERVVELQGQLSEALAQRERLERELIAIRGRQDQQAKTSPSPSLRQAGVASSVPSAPATSVRVIAPDAAAKAGLPRLTTFPNVVTGIVKDHYGNLLSGMLITVRDKDDIPLRALKTNKLGQFAASTPLPNNTYIVEIEDPKGAFIFDKAQISLAGLVAPPIEVTAKSQREVERDKLAKEIFGNQPM